MTDPKKKKKQDETAGAGAAAPASSLPIAQGPNPVEGVSYDEYNERLRRVLRGAQAGQATTGSSPEATPSAQPQEPAKAPEQGTSFADRLAQGAHVALGLINPAARGDNTNEHGADPNAPFWQRLVFGVKGENRLDATLRSGARGAVGAVNEMSQTAFEGGAAIARHTGYGEWVTPGYNAAYDENGAHGLVGDMGVVSKGTVEKYLGKRSDDPIASFAEGATQFGLGFELGGELRWASGAAKLNEARGLAGMATAMLRGAMVDASSFDPYEAQLAELAARLPGDNAMSRSIRGLGQILSVDEEKDGPIIARAKRAAAGAIPGVAIDIMGTAYRVIRYGREFATAVTPEEKALVREKLDREAKKLADLQSGAKAPADEPLMVRENDNGTVSLVANPEHPQAAQVEEMLTGAKQDATVANWRKKLAEIANPQAKKDRKALEALQQENATLREQNASLQKNTTDLTTQRDEARRMAETDPMTAFGNEHALERAKAKVDADPSGFWLFFDLDNLKALNEFGMKVGDAFIKRAAAVIRDATGSERGFRVGAATDWMEHLGFRRKGDELFIPITGVTRERAVEIRSLVEDAYGHPDFKGVKASLTGEVFSNSDEMMSESAKQALDARKLSRKQAAGMATDRKAAVAEAKAALGNGPEFADKAEALAQMAPASEAVKAQLAGSELTPEHVEQIREVVQHLNEATSPEDFVSRLETSNFNWKFLKNDREPATFVEAVARVMKSQIDAAQRRPNGTTVAEFAQEVQQYLLGLPGNKAAATVTEDLAKSAGQAVRVIAADAVMRSEAKVLSTMYEVLTARPHDEVQHELFRQRLIEFYKLQRELAGANSEWGLQGRMMQERGHPDMQVTAYGKPTEEQAKQIEAATTEVKKGADEVKKEIDAAKQELHKAKKAARKAEKEAKKAAKKEPKPQEGPTVGPNTETVMAKTEIQAAQQANREAAAAGDGADAGVGKQHDPSAQPLNASTDTAAGLTTNDFTLARAREKAQAAQQRLQKFLNDALGDEASQYDPWSAQALDNASLRAERTKMAADAQRADPLTAPDVPSVPKAPGNPIDELSKEIEKSEQALDRAMKRARQKIEDKALGVGRRPGAPELPDHNPVDAFKRRAAESAKAAEEDDIIQSTAGMTHRELRDVASLFSMTGGDIRNVWAVARAASVLRRTGKLNVAMEVMANFLLSGPRTPLTALISGSSVAVFEPLMRVAAGVVKGDRKLVQFGADMLWANAKYVGDNLKSMGLAFRAGRSLMNPMQQYVAIGGHVGESLTRGQQIENAIGTLVRLPGRTLTALDEFIKATGYRSYVRAKSLRMGREMGLVGKELEAKVEADLLRAFDDKTGIAMIPEALEFADKATFSAPLEYGFGKHFHDLTNNAILAKFVAPFVKASVNLFRYAHEMTPGLNKFSKEAKEIYAAAAKPTATAAEHEALATLHAKETVATMIYLGTAFAAFEGRVTGRGPSDPKLREAWLQGEDGMGRQPYSIRVGDKWISYRKYDPFGTPIGLVADLVEFGREMANDGDVGIEDGIYAAIASMMSNFANKTYLSGLAQFTEAFATNDPHAVGRWLQNFAGNMAVPQLVSSLNGDDYYREVGDLVDAIAARVPGWSSTLMPRYNAMGEAVMKSAPVKGDGALAKVVNVANRGVNPFTVKSGGASTVEDKILEISQGISKPPTELEGGIDLSDRKWDTEHTGMRPYERWMQYVRDPKYGGNGLRADLTEMIKEPGFDELSKGTKKYPGGVQGLKLVGLAQRHYARAFREMLDDYPELANKYYENLRIKGAAIRAGDEGVAEVEDLFQ